MEEHIYTVRIEPAEEGGFWANVPALPGCVTQGETYEEVVAMAKDAIQGYLESCLKAGEPLPVEHHPRRQGRITLGIPVEVPAGA